MKVTSIIHPIVQRGVHLLLAVTLAVACGHTLPAAAQTSAQLTPPNKSAAQTPQRIISGIVPDLPTGYMIIEGDIQVRIADYERATRVGTNTLDIFAPQAGYINALWPNGIVPFEFDDNVSAQNQISMTRAMGHWEQVANVDFQLCLKDCGSADHLHIQNSSGNNSAVGRQGGEQIVNITNWDFDFIMAHELAHALGFIHEQARPDRDQWVTIHLENVCKATDMNCSGGLCFRGATQIDCDHNFDIRLEAFTYGPYDFDSVMHYTRDAFSRNTSDTITVKPPNEALSNTIGQTTHLSVLDKATMAVLYPFANWRFADARVATSGTGLTLQSPYRTFAEGTTNVPSGGTIVIAPGLYSGVGLYTKRQTWWSPAGITVIGQ